MPATRSADTADAQATAIARWLRAGDGEGASYAPWHTVQRVPTHGQANRVLGRASGREHHLLSAIETDCLYLLDWCDDVLDVREQYPLLPLEATVRLADELGVAHPCHPRLRYPVVMTTDFLVSRRGPVGTVTEALAVKLASALEDARTLEKLEIERRYWAARATRWQLVTERELPRVVVQNVRWLAPARDVRDVPVPPTDLPALLAALYAEIAPADAPLARTCSQYDARLGLRLGTALALVRHALATKRWRTDLMWPISPDQPLQPLWGPGAAS
jgi:hypothetical protein